MKYQIAYKNKPMGKKFDTEQAAKVVLLRLEPAVLHLTVKEVAA